MVACRELLKMGHKDNMIKKLRRKITFTITGMVALVLFLSLGLAIFINNTQQTKQLKESLHMQIINRTLTKDTNNAAAQEVKGSLDCLTYVIQKTK